MQNTGAEINILPAQAKQFPKPQAGKKNETDKHAVAVLIAALHQAGLFVSCQYYDLRLASSRKIHAICGITVDISLRNGETQCLMQKQIEVYDCFWTQLFCFCFVIIILLQNSRCQLLQLYISQSRIQMDTDVAFIAQVGRLLQRRPHISFQTERKPFAHSYRLKIIRCMIANKGKLVKQFDCFLLCFCIAGNSSFLAGCIVDPDRNADLPSAVGAQANISLSIFSCFRHIGHIPYDNLREPCSAAHYQSVLCFVKNNDLLSCEKMRVKV